MPHEETDLGNRLRDLREHHPLTPAQADIAEALRVARQAVSAWEQGRKPIPPKRIEELARLFAVEPAGRSRLRLKPKADLSPAEAKVAEELRSELSDLAGEGRRRGARVSSLEPGWFWRFDDGLPITIIGSKHPDSALRGLPMADQHHPDYVEMLWHADADAEVELYGHLRAINPTVTVERVLPDLVRNPGVSGHVVVLGGGRVNPWADWFAAQMEVPIARVHHDDSTKDLRDWKERRFRMRRTTGVPSNGLGDHEQADDGDWETFRPVFEGTTRIKNNGGVSDSEPRLAKDVALIARTANPLRPRATVTLFAGLFSRGTYGAVRAFTDPNLLPDNEAYVAARTDGDARHPFWTLHQVLAPRSISALDSAVSITATVNLTSDEYRLQERFA